MLTLYFSQKLLEFNIRGAIRLAASDEKMADFSDRVIQELKEKHPPRQAKRSKQLNSEITPVNCSTREIKEANLFFPSGSAGGPDRISPQVLKDLVNVKREVGTYLLSSLTAFTNVVVSGHVPEKVHLFFFGASLFALGKKNGGVRPIAAGNVFRRLASKYEGRRYYSDWKSSFGSLRLVLARQKR